MTHYSALDDIRLLHLLQENDEAAFAEMYNRHWEALYATAYNIIRQEAVAKDAVQEVFITLWQRRNEADIQALLPYLKQAVRFQILKAIRAQKADEQFYTRLAAVTVDVMYNNPLLFKENEALFRKIIHSLPDDCRQVFLLSREQQFTYKQIAGWLNISEKTVEKKMTICLKHVKHMLAQSDALTVSVLLIVCFCD
ncbi:RNA polymerase sigma-70 factor (ECF subfamily) [Filimonas zeae]|uniref:DNA-directed RNA polymerase sigma-70 factor n=1 Tax=Filimonas zeae TaxID=1737353 RepID=A0A917J0H8_9BACT|nr:sigma-70 family RNA polymerase sigma factor [Filimonas zeae]MDR6340750.1 RNA polymerase sigma-70 factor (ECF subfamily) [Filimonas zeae]GGH74196.1 DNA-directed RNA polymerase sigma-70 factor [Filimonas zeae]